MIEQDLGSGAVQLANGKIAAEPTLSPSFIFSFMIFFASWLRTPAVSALPSLLEWSRTVPRRFAGVSSHYKVYLLQRGNQALTHPISSKSSTEN